MEFPYVWLCLFSRRFHYFFYVLCLEFLSVIRHKDFPSVLSFGVHCASCSWMGTYFLSLRSFSPVVLLKNCSMTSTWDPPPLRYMLFLSLWKHKNKENPTKKRVWFILANCSWAWVLPWSVVNGPSFTPVKKTDFPFSHSSCYLWIASWLFVPMFPPLRCVWKVWFPYHCSPLLALTIFLPSPPRRSLSPEGRDMIDILSGVNIPKSPSLCTLIRCGSLC